MVWTTYRKRFRTVSRRGVRSRIGKVLARRYRSRRQMIPRGLRNIVPTIMPDSFLTKLRYSTTIQLNAVSDVAVGHIFGANCLYDPDITGAGHQPKGLDELFTFYRKGYVLASKFSMTPIEEAVVNVSPISFYGVALCDDASVEIVGKTMSDLREDKQISRRIRCAGNNVAYSNLKNYNTASIRYGYKKFWGKRTELTDVMNEVTASANPSRIAQFVAWSCGGPSGLSNPAEQSFVIDIEFLCMFKDMTVLAQS